MDRDIFINCPFDDEYRPLFQSLVFVIADCGFRARCALELVDSGELLPVSPGEGVIAAPELAPLPAKADRRGHGGPAGLARVIAADVGKCEKVETHVQREGWETLGGDCRMAGRELPAGCHL